MDIHPSCRRLHKIPAHTVKELWNRPQRLLPFAPTFPPLRAAHCRPAYLLRQHLFSRPFHRSETLLPMPLRRLPREAFVVASRLLCQAFRFRQHLLSKWLASGSFRGCRLAATPASGEGKYVPIRVVCEGGKTTFFTPPPSHSSYRGPEPPEPLVALRPIPAGRGQSCACPPAPGLRNRARTPAGRPPQPRHPPSPHAL